MAAIAPAASLLGLLTTGLGAAGTLAGFYDRELGRRQQAALRDAQGQQQAAEAAERIEAIRRAQGEDDRRRRAALRRAVASRRASFGAQGIVTDGGSGEALLLGLVDDAAAEQAAARQDSAARIQALRRDLDYRQRVNLLDGRRDGSRRTLDLLTTLDRLL